MMGVAVPPPPLSPFPPTSLWEAPDGVLGAAWIDFVAEREAGILTPHPESLCKTGEGKQGSPLHQLRSPLS